MLKHKTGIAIGTLLLLSLAGCNGSGGGGGSSPGGPPSSQGRSDLECSSQDITGAVQRCLYTRDPDTQARAATRIGLWGPGLQSWLGRRDAFPIELLTTVGFQRQFSLNATETDCLKETLCSQKQNTTSTQSSHKKGEL